MLYSELAEMFDRMGSTSSRLEMATIMSEFFKRIGPADLKNVIYMIQGKLHPDFHPDKLGMAEKLVFRAIVFTTRENENEAEKLWIKEGDLGTLAEILVGRKKQKALFSEPLTFGRVLRTLQQIENTDGRNSQEKKMQHLADMLHDCGPVEARYLCRTVTGKMRTGAASMTVIDALAEAFADKGSRDEIERAFNITSDLGLVAETLSSDGIDAVRGMKVAVGNPIKVMLAERLPSIGGIIERMKGVCAFEYKYDGIRVQAHIGNGGVRLYSRRLEDLTENFRDIGDALKENFKGKEAIVEGECVSVGPDGRMLAFQTVTHRRRKHGLKDALEKYPVKMFMFDLLYIDGRDMTTEPYLKRRETLSEVFGSSVNVGMSTMKVVGSEAEGETFFDKALEDGCEGIMAKSVADDSLYRAGSRGFVWIKYKKDYRTDLTDTFDLVTVGAFYGMGKRTGRYGALLMAAYNHDTGTYETVCKLGTGFDDAFLEEMPALLDGHKKERKPNNVTARMVPDVWFDPAVVLEVGGAEISTSPVHTTALGKIKADVGLGLRFPRFTGRVRDDKGPEESTTVREIMEMYDLQPTS
jgi:DNA ligase-1